MLASGGSVAMAQVSGPSADQAPALSSAPQAPHAARAAAASASPASPAVSASAASDHTISGGWKVQSSAATTDWTSGNGATQGGSAISAPGFSTAGWLPVTADDAGAVGTEVEALLQNGLCPLDQSLQPVNQSADSTSSVFYSNNMQQCFGPPQT
ncbi:MAG: hypothetical protein ACRDPO_32505, partial [Streptosporangiaceae bacterium]